MNQPNNEGCHACSGRGWLVLFNTDAEALELQRCDACVRFASDEDARRHVASSKTCIVLALHELCESVLTEAAHTLQNHSKNTTATNTLAAFHRSLRNTVALGRKASREDCDTP